MKFPIWLRRSLFVVLWLTAVFIAAKLTILPVHATESEGCTRCNFVMPTNSPGSGAISHEIEDSDELFLRCMEFDNIEPSHCSNTYRRHHVWYGKNHTFISDGYEELCDTASPTSTTCPFFVPPPH